MESMLGAFSRRNVFDLTHERKFSGKMGFLIPILVEDILPGDTWKLQTDMILRLAPMLAPMMHRVNVFTHFFFVPNRLIWTNWESFITGGENGADATVAPWINLCDGVANGELADYLGLPTIGASGAEIRASALPFRAYNLIYNEWFRDQNLQTKKVIDKGDGEDTTTPRTLLRRNWQKDYFTSALLWPQRGTAPQLSMGASAPVGAVNPVHGTFQQAKIDNSGVRPLAMNDTDFTSGNDLAVADLSLATAVNINEIRLAFQIQKFMERSARGGSRYVEQILSHFGVRSSDARLQRPEFLGGGRSPVIVSEVLQTSATGATGTPLGQMAGHGFSAHRSHEFTHSFEEHGWLFGLLSVMPDPAYQQGLPRRWSRSTRYDFYFPEFAHIGEQGVLKKEIYVANGIDVEAVFGYQGRYDEYRHRESSVHGDFRNASGLGLWHLGRIFGANPTLDDTFVTCEPATRPFCAPNEDTCYIQLVNQIQAIRPMPITGEPGLVDHN